VYLLSHTQIATSYFKLHDWRILILKVFTKKAKERNMRKQSSIVIVIVIVIAIAIPCQLVQVS
jgi:hypothetical protein